jgi:hypothetical protein
MRMTVVVIVAFVAALRMVAVVVVVAFAFAVIVSGVVMSAMVRMPMRALRMVAMIVASALSVCVMVVCVIMSAMLRMPMRALRMVVMIMACAVRVSVSVIVIVIVIVRVSVMFVEDLLRERVVLYKRLVMPVLVTAAIRARLRLKRSRGVLHMRAQTLEHVFQHRIGFQFQLSRGHFHRRVPIAQVVRSAREGNGIVGVYNQHILRRGNHANQAAIVGDQHVTVAQHRAARQHQRHFLTVIQRDGQAAPAAVIEGKGERGRALDQRCGKFRFNTFVDRAHRVSEIRIGSSAAPSARRLPARR